MRLRIEVVSNQCKLPPLTGFGWIKTKTFTFKETGEKIYI